MENPKFRRIRQNASLRHPRLQRRHSLRKLSSSDKSNPYVGWFRHSPSSKVKISLRDDFKAKQMKRSPYVGWFRHSPPSRFVIMNKKRIAQFEQDLIKFIAVEQKIQKLKMADGYLKGGSPSSTWNSETIKRTLEDTSAGSPSATVQVLSRLATWFLFPLAHDESSCGYSHGELSEKQVVDLFPNVFATPTTRVESDDDSSTVTNDDSNCDQSEESSCYTIGTHLPLHRSEYQSSYQQQRGDDEGDDNDIPHELTVSSLAAAYYAHQEAETFDQSLHLNDDDSFGSSGSERLDYVITQMDIARMARNASRHLDVESIMSLPTTTYHCDSDEGEETGASWMIVPPAPEEDIRSSDSCVICMERFQEGDRLRVLPCGHSFHVGCIDVWLSGSHSFDECITSGCPTCKKRPAMEASIDGSVPSWAFTKLGDAMATQSQHSS